MQLAQSFRWYWFHLAGQAGFIIREIFVIETLDGWYWEVCAANIAMWMVVLLTARQIWQFSKVRERSPKAVDQILDMLLLPINYGFLCALCVRILKLENTGQNRTIVSAMIDSADIWEAWALWSVLRLFVRVVDKGSERTVERENDLRQQQAMAAMDSQTLRLPPNAAANEVLNSQTLTLPQRPSPREELQAVPLKLLEEQMEEEVRRSVSWPGPTRSWSAVKERAHSEESPSHQERGGVALSGGQSRHEEQSSTRGLVLAEGDPHDDFSLPPDLEQLEGAPNGRCTDEKDLPPKSEVSRDDLVPAELWTLQGEANVQLEVSDSSTEAGATAPREGPRSREGPRGTAEEDGSTVLSSDFNGGLDHEQPGTGHRYLEVVNAFKRLSLSGVQAWVVILLVTTALEIIFKGILAPTMPTLCYRVYGNCDSCNVWYDKNIYPTAQGIIYMLCSAALLFVVAFERVFKDYLHPIQPYWKFWGVKIVVSVTYFQWLLFKYGFRLDDEEIYLWHSLVCSLEMPILCILHATYAYPYGKLWVTNLLDELAEVSMALKDDASPELPKESSVTRLRKCCEKLERCFYTSSKFVMSGTASVLIVCWLLPPELDLQTMPPLYNLTCEEASVPAFLKEHRKGSKKESQWKIHHYNGLTFEGQEWLPLCASQSFECPLGYKGEPVVSCTAAGHMQLQGSCQLVGCGPPLKVEHADYIIKNNEAKKGWTSGMMVEYQCERGYDGRPSATCGPDGNWKIEGDESCSLIGCGSLETFLQSKHLLSHGHGGWQDTMTMTGAHDLDRSYVGEAVRFTCSPGYWGRPVALCHEGGQWEIDDPCMPFQTSMNCSCKPHWVHCAGLLQTDCQEYYGCAAPAASAAWCEVDHASCPRGAADPLGLQPSWDYCVNDNFDIDWHPRHVADRGLLSKQAGLYIGAFILSAACSFCIFRCLVGVALPFVGQKVFDFVLQALLACDFCVARIPRVLRRQGRVAAWRLHRQSGRGSAAIASAWRALRQRMKRPSRGEADLSCALLEEGREGSRHRGADVPERGLPLWRRWRQKFWVLGATAL
ncbi:unnamed protein product [Durusdinium trenchii]|uniref:Sushi domain-containing protein n=1 Tax=Durusdinium trenchii TaxID=1381693 RepID=A0ABP0IB66_9DINO